MIEAFGHKFTDFGEAEMICNTCGYVIWPVTSPAGAQRAIEVISNKRVHCGGAWHVYRYEPLPCVTE